MPRNTSARLDALSNEVLQLIFAYATDHADTEVLDLSTAISLLEVSSLIRANLVEAARVYGTGCLQVQIRKYLRVRKQVLQRATDPVIEDEAAWWKEESAVAQCPWVCTLHSGYAQQQPVANLRRVSGDFVRKH